jgi:SH3-like domain-containing protein
MKKIFFWGLLLTFLFIFNSHAGAICVSASTANLRTGPGTKYEKSWQVFKYMPFKKLLKQGNWYKIRDVDGDDHWIYNKLVTEKFNCAVVKVEKANVRTGAGTTFPLKEFGPALIHDTFKVIKRQGQWVNVIDEYGNTGWVFRKLLWIY